MSLRVLAGRLLRHPTMTLCHGGPIECNYFQNKKVLQSKLLQPDIISRFVGFQKFKCRRRTASKTSYGQRHLSATVTNSKYSLRNIIVNMKTRKKCPMVQLLQVQRKPDELAPLFLSSTFYKHRQVGSGGKAKRKNAQGKKNQKFQLSPKSLPATSGCFLVLTFPLIIIAQNHCSVWNSFH